MLLQDVPLAITTSAFLVVAAVCIIGVVFYLFKDLRHFHPTRNKFEDTH